MERQNNSELFVWNVRQERTREREREREKKKLFKSDIMVSKREKVENRGGGGGWVMDR